MSTTATPAIDSAAWIAGNEQDFTEFVMKHVDEAIRRARQIQAGGTTAAAAIEQVTAEAFEFHPAVGAVVAEAFQVMADHAA